MSSLGTGKGAAWRHQVPRSTDCGSQVAVRSAAVLLPGRSARLALATFGITLAGNLPFLSSLSTAFGRGLETIFTAASRAASTTPVTERTRPSDAMTSAACLLMGGASYRDLCWECGR